MMHRYRELSAEEKAIIIDKATEIPGTGEYEHNKSAGVYVCKRCDLPLFLSSAKFDSGCGWPSYDEEIINSVLKLKDADNKRIEILCVRCKAHLGHIFFNEGFSAKNTRYCVNSLSLLFVPAFTKEGFERAIFAGGCFWGVEHLLRLEKGLREIRSGYIGGHIIDPSYEEVCSDKSAHAEAVEIIFDNKVNSFENLAKAFFEIHDPTTLNRQGPDIGSQYRSAIFYLTKEQREISIKLISILKNKGLNIVTELSPASVFYGAEEYHQKYYIKNKKEPYCHKRIKLF